MKFYNLFWWSSKPNQDEYPVSLAITPLIPNLLKSLNTPPRIKPTTFPIRLQSPHMFLPLGESLNVVSTYNCSFDFARTIAPPHNIMSRGLWHHPLFMSFLFGHRHLTFSFFIFLWPQLPIYCSSLPQSPTSFGISVVSFSSLFIRAY